MLSKNQVAFIRSLSDKKHRQENKLFIAEGGKSCMDILGSNLTVKRIYASALWLKTHMAKIKPETEIVETEARELEKISRHQTPQDALMLVQLPDYEIQSHHLQGNLTILLDTIQDPGNLGTIIRVADWYGVSHIICSPDCADAWNPKTVDSTMGSIGRVMITYKPLAEVIHQNPLIPVFGAVLNGSSIYETRFTKEAFLLIGNEGKGIAESLTPLITNPISIPRAGKAESLNAAIATGIICDHFARARL